jgi:riboflavin kinase/FMN adenylyltransferase
LAVKIFDDLTELASPYRSGAVAIGNFDGVHRGHARIAGRLRELAQQVGGPAIVFTFDPHPVRLLRPAEAPPPLTWTDRKAELLAQLGIDAMIAYPTDEALLRLAPSEFFEQIVRERLDARGIVEGPNFRFGRGRAGNIEVLRSLAAGAGIRLDVVDPLIVDGEIVSSSRVRNLLLSGAVEAARRLLTAPFRLRGMVVHGAGRGAKIGFPTANLDAIDTLLPGPGVYAGRAFLRGSAWPAAINIGPNPTFGEHALKVEVHVIGWHEPLYHQPLEVDFLRRLREIEKFASLAALTDQLRQDVAAASAAVEAAASEIA